MSDSDIIGTGETWSSTYAPGKEILLSNSTPGPQDFEIRTTVGSIIRFTIPQGGTVSVLSMGDIEKIDLTVQPLDTTEGLHVVKND